MTASTLGNMYQYLTAEERFRLILAAAGRGDYAERDRLAQASKKLSLQAPDFKPWADAFTELAMIIFMEIVEIAARHRESIRDWVDVAKSLEHSKAADGPSGEPRGLPDHGEMSEDEQFDVKLLGTSFAIGFILKTKVAGWKLFCERMNVPAFTIWKSLPGYERLEQAMAEVDETKTRFPAAFAAEHMLGFLRNNRLEGFPEATEDGLLSAEACADGLGKMLRDGVKQHGG